MDARTKKKRNKFIAIHSYRNNSACRALAIDKKHSSTPFISKICNCQFTKKKIYRYIYMQLSKHTLPARPSRTPAITTAQAPVPQANVAPTIAMNQ